MLADPNEPKLDLTKVQFTNWVDKDGHQCAGMKDEETDLEHGVVRVLRKDESVTEGAYRNGRIHGLARQVTKDSVRISLYKDGDEMAYFAFAEDYIET